MCGRFSDRFTWKQIHDLYRLTAPLDPEDAERWKGRINIPPTVQIPAIRSGAGVRRLDLMRWGLVPGWSKSIGKFSTHNAKLETVADKPVFRDSWKKKRRCLIPAEAFYEWRKPEKTSFAIGLANGGPMAFAGLWDIATIDGGALLSCTLLTTVPNSVMLPIHDRMPIIVSEEDWPLWLGEQEPNPEDDARMLAGISPERMRAWQVSQKVGKVQCQDEDLMEAV